MAQPTPYDPMRMDRMVPLRQENGRPTARCPYTNGLLLSCSICHRLHTMDDVECAHGDGGNLSEPTLRFPTPTGENEGGNQVIIGRNFARSGRTRGELIGNLRVHDKIQILLYRYGMLLAISSSRLRTFAEASDVIDTPGGTRPFWAEQNSVALPFGPTETITLADVQNGRVWVQAKNSVAILSLSAGGKVEESWPEVARFTVYDTARREWVRVIERNRRAFLKRGDANGEETPLGILADGITDLRVGKPFGISEAFIATQGHGLLRVRLDGMGAPENLPVLPTGQPWFRLVLPPSGTGGNSPTLLALSIGDNSGTVTIWDKDAVPTIAHTIVGSVIPEIAVAPDGTVYLFRSQGTAISLMVLPQTHAGIAEERNIGNAFDVEPGFVLLHGPDSEYARLLITRKDRGTVTLRSFGMLNPVGGALADIGPRHLGAIGFAVAEDRVVVTTIESDATTRLRTFELLDII